MCSALIFGACSGVYGLPVASASVLGDEERRGASTDVDAETI